MDHVILEIGLALLLIGIAEALERDLHQHIQLENNILFPKAVELEESLLREMQSS